MDVLIRLSLQGGHEWDTTCDEDDPIVFGLVSALPGAALDASLPPDGLIQVEKKTGERLFLSRSSLVAVSVRRLPSGRQADGAVPFAASPASSQLVLPAAFASLHPFLGPENAASLVGLACAAPSGEAARELRIDSLPSPIADRFVEAMAAGARALGRAVDADAALDLRFFVVEAADDSFAIPARAGAGTLLVACWQLGETMPQARLELADRPAGGIDPAAHTSRVLDLLSDGALLLDGPPEKGAIGLEWGAEGGKMLIASAVLVPGTSPDDA